MVKWLEGRSPRNADPSAESKISSKVSWLRALGAKFTSQSSKKWIQEMKFFDNLMTIKVIRAF